MVMYGHGAKVANTEENRKEKEKDKEWEIEKDGQDNCSREGKGDQHGGGTEAEMWK